jgi:hypothetical protein
MAEDEVPEFKPQYCPPPQKNFHRGARDKWLIPVILASHEAETRRIASVQAWANSFTRPFLKKQNKTKQKIPKKGWWSGSRCRP